MATKMTYEEAIARLEKIVEILGNGSVSLDESLKLYEESTKLTALCNGYLEKAKLKITELSKPE